MILVTGATGNVGRPLIATCSSARAPRFALSRATRRPLACPPMSRSSRESRHSPIRSLPRFGVSPAYSFNPPAIGEAVDELLSSEIEKILGRPGLTYAEWVADHATAFRNQQEGQGVTDEAHDIRGDWWYRPASP